jgi:ankyrin repeat protein
LKELISSHKLGKEEKSKEGMTPLILAVDCEFSADTIEFLINSGCEVDAVDNIGRSALHYAIDLDNEEIVEILLKNGADPELKDN